MSKDRLVLAFRTVHFRLFTFLPFVPISFIHDHPLSYLSTVRFNSLGPSTLTQDRPHETGVTGPLFNKIVDAISLSLNFWDQRPSKMAIAPRLILYTRFSYLLINDMISDIMTDKLMLCCLVFGWRLIFGEGKIKIWNWNPQVSLSKSKNMSRSLTALSDQIFEFLV